MIVICFGFMIRMMNLGFWDRLQNIKNKRRIQTEQ